MVVLIKEAGIPPWGGRLVLQLQNLISGISSQISALTAATDSLGFVYWTGSGSVLWQGAAYVQWAG